MPAFINRGISECFSFDCRRSTSTRTGIFFEIAIMFMNIFSRLRSKIAISTDLAALCINLPSFTSHESSGLKHTSPSAGAPSAASLTMPFAALVGAGSAKTGRNIKTGIKIKYRTKRVFDDRKRIMRSDPRLSRFFFNSYL